MDSHITRYQSANLSDEEIKKNFVVRKLELTEVINELDKSRAKDSIKHYVFIGRRGSGKSTLLRRIEAELNTTKKLNKKYIAINLGEEQSGIYKLHDLWSKTIAAMNLQGFKIPELDFKLFINDQKAYGKRLHSLIIEALRKSKQRLVLLLDNIDRILRKCDDALLRELLMNFNDIRIIGASTYMSEEFWEYNKPFYEFFTVKRLEALSIEEIKLLLDHWAELTSNNEIAEFINKYPGKLQSIRMLTDGLPRTMLLFVNLLINRKEQNGYEYLKIIVDKATPIYQERLGTLSPGQQKVLTELALNWDAATIEELIPRCNMEGKTISAFLSQLYKLHYVEKIKTDTKNLVYRLEERFFNLWLIMTQGGPKEQLEVKYLSEFLEAWYDENELELVYNQFVNQVKEGDLNEDYVKVFSNALLGTKSLSQVHQLQLKSLLTTGLSTEEIDIQIPQLFFARKYSKVIEILEETKAAEKYFFFHALSYNYLGNNIAAKNILVMASKGANGITLCAIATMLEKIGYFDIAENIYKRGIAKQDIEVMTSYASVLRERGKTDQSKKLLIKAIELGSIDAHEGLGLTLLKEGKYQEAENNFILAIEKGRPYALKSYLDSFRPIKKNKEIESILEKYPMAVSSLGSDYLSRLYLHLGNFAKFDLELNTFLSDSKKLPSPNLILSLVINHQKKKALELFEANSELTVKYKTIYYAILEIIDPNHSKLKKLAPELEANKNDIVEFFKSSQNSNTKVF